MKFKCDPAEQISPDGYLTPDVELLAFPMQPDCYDAPVSASLGGSNEWIRLNWYIRVKMPFDGVGIRPV